MNEWMDERMNERMKEQTNEWMNEILYLSTFKISHNKFVVFGEAVVDCSLNILYWRRQSGNRYENIKTYLINRAYIAPTYAKKPCSPRRGLLLFLEYFRVPWNSLRSEKV